MGIIITIPTFVDADNPTPAETAANAVYMARAQTARDMLSPDIAVRFTAAQIPDAIIFESGSLRVDEATVMAHAGRSVAQVQALADDSEELASLVYAVLVLRAKRYLPQCAQMIREGLLGDSKQFQEIDWELREKRLDADYKSAVKLVNPSATFEATESGSLGSPRVESTKSRLGENW